MPSDRTTRYKHAPPSGRRHAAAAFAALAGLCMLVVTAAGPGAFAATRAVVIGIDQYAGALALGGAAADARDIASVVRQAGAGDVTLLVNAEANLKAVTKALAGVTSRTAAGDLVIVSFAGLGSVARVGPESGAQAKSKVLVLSGFDPQRPSASHVIGLDDIHAAIVAMEARGARVLGVIDAGFGDDKVRSTDARASRPFRIRSVPALALDVKTKAVPRAPGQTLARSTIIEAGAQGYTVPEIEIFGYAGWRGALSFAIARGIELANSKGAPPAIDELAAYAGFVAYQLSDQRQDVVATGATRGVKQVAGPGASVRPQLPTAPVIKGKRQGPVVPIATVDGRVEPFKGLTPEEYDFVVVAPSQRPLLVWDPAKKEVIAGGDVVATDLVPDDIPGVVDRMIAVRDIKKLTAQSPQPMIVLPNGDTHRQGQKVVVEIESVEKRSLVLFSIAGNGKVQLLYPLGSDPPIITTPSYKLELVVQAPFGSDQLVAVTSSERMTDIELALKRLTDRRASGQLPNILTHYAPANWRIGSVAVFTAR